MAKTTNALKVMHAMQIMANDPKAHRVCSDNARVRSRRAACDSFHDARTEAGLTQREHFFGRVKIRTKQSVQNCHRLEDAVISEGPIHCRIELEADRGRGWEEVGNSRICAGGKASGAETREIGVTA